jgi:transketolase
MNAADKEILHKIANTVRAISADAIERQKSGHPGLPLGAADIGTYLFTQVLRHNPKNPAWMGRDRFVLSAGHGSMLLYSLLHLCGYDLSIEDIKNFRQLHSLTPGQPGHPEYGETPGVETTTGPLGQGVAVGTGMAIAQKFLAARFGKRLFNSKIWILAGDGCIMEGVSSEAGSLAGMLNLDNLVIIYDSNDVCLDGPASDCLTEDTCKRYEAYGFNVLTIDGYDYDQMEAAFSTARSEKKQPTLIIAKTIIGKHCPNREGKSISHGKFLGPEEMKLFKNEIGWPQEPTFHIPEEVRDYLSTMHATWAKYEHEWNYNFKTVIAKDPKLLELWNIFSEKRLPQDFEEQIWNLDITPNQATRKYNEAVVQKLGKMLPYFVTGSADVASCDFTWILDDTIIKKNDWMHQQFKFGVREFGMACCATGMNLHGMLQPVIGTFLVFSDYMRNAVRMSALMRQHIIYVYSHDSIVVAQDGPTHQPVEHLMSLRLIPNLTMIRPADENETKAAWVAALQVENQPVALCFTRQPVDSTVSDLTAEKAKRGVPRGAYILYGEEGIDVDVEIFTTGSEIHPSVGAAKKLQQEGLKIRVVSVPSWELLDRQPDAYRQSILESKADLKVSIEAGIGLGWQKFVGKDGLIISQETFGASAPEPVMADHFGFTAEKIYQRIKKRILV